MSAAKQFLQLHTEDNVFIALSNLSAGTQLQDADVQLLDSIDRGHKIAAKNINKDSHVIRYGNIIGQALKDIAKGEHVHSHNLGMSQRSPKRSSATTKNTRATPTVERTFMGYKRPNGQVGTRNYIGILTTVNCAGSVARFIAEAAEKNGLLNDYPNIDGIVPIVHNTGCGMSGDNEGYATLKRTLEGYARNPNFGGILIIGLGCEVLQVGALVDGVSQTMDSPFRHMTIQGEGGTRKSIQRGLDEIKVIASLVEGVQRTEQAISHITLGMQCGGSDGYSGITANPALGVASDLLVQHGATSILSETSEIYGAEHLLTNRAVSQEVSDKLMSRIRWWEDYCERNGGELDNNPSPGNKRGGLTTILEKSLGAVAKGGVSPLTEFYLFAEKIDKKGFVFMDSPGYDPCSVTGQVASGANVIVFTTGRGSVSGYKPAPCIKLSTNTEMYQRMSEDMDINCGDVISDGISVEQKGHEIFEKIISVASGELSKSEEFGFGGVEFVPWQIGAVM